MVAGFSMVAIIRCVNVVIEQCIVVVKHLSWYISFFHLTADDVSKIS